MDTGVALARQSSVQHPLPITWLGRPTAPDVRQPLAPFNLAQTKAILAEIAYVASKWTLSQYNTATNRLGAYAASADMLAQYGYLNAGFFKTYKDTAVNYAYAWTGKEGVMSQDAFLQNNSAQTQLAQWYMTNNYADLLANGAISVDDDLQTQAGMLVVAHFLGAGSAKSSANAYGTGAWNWRFYGTGAYNNIAGAELFNCGAYAIVVLAG
jgi:hypothetical protein